MVQTPQIYMDGTCSATDGQCDELNYHAMNIFQPVSGGKTQNTEPCLQLVPWKTSKMKEQTQFQSRPSGGHHHGVYLTDSHFQWNKLNKPQFLELGDMGPDTSMNPAEQCTTWLYTCMIIATTANWTGNKLVSQECTCYLTFNSNYLANAGAFATSHPKIIIEASGSQQSRQSMAVIAWPCESKDSKTEVNDLGWEDEHLHRKSLVNSSREFPPIFFGGEGDIPRWYLSMTLWDFWNHE